MSAQIKTHASPLGRLPALVALAAVAVLALWTFALQQAWAAAPPVNTVAPSISGSPDVGRTLTANPGTWTGDPTITYDYQWQSCTESWTALANPAAASGTAWFDVAYGGASGSEQYVAVGVGTSSAGRIITSPDGVNWSAQQDPGPESLKEWRAVAYGAGRFVAVGDYGGSGAERVMTSTDGINWSYATTVPTTTTWQSLAYGGGKFVATAYSGTVMTSTDGLTWTVSSGTLDTMAKAIGYGNGRFVVVGNDKAWYSTNGDTFTSTTTPGSSKYWRDVTYGGGKWVAVGTAGFSGANDSAMVSTDNGSTWTQTTIPSVPWWAVTYADGQFTAAGNGANSIGTSSDGTSWTTQTTPNLGSYSVTTGAGTTVAVGDAGGGAAGPIATLSTTCSDISGADGSTYQLQAGDQGKKIKVKVTATNGSGSANATSAATAAVGPEPSPSAPANTSPPTISGTAEVGNTLTATSPGSWTGYPDPTFAYQWQRCEGGDPPVTYPLGAPYPTDIVTDPAGNVYVSQRVPGAPGKVRKITLPAGTVSEVGSTGELPRAITRDSAGNLYTANQTGHNVTKIAPDGTTSTFALPGVNPEPWDIALDSTGNIYVANKNLNTVAKLQPDGTPAGGNWPVSVPGGPRGLAFDSVGKLYVTTQTVNSVTKLNPDGTAAGAPWPVSTAAGVSGPYGIAIDSSDNVFVANVTAQSVTKIAPDGTATTPFASLGTIPFGLTIDRSNGNIYTANPIADTVSKVTLDGTASVLGTLSSGAGPVAVAVGAGGKVYSSNEGGASVTEFGPSLTCTDISGADDPSYSPTADDVGKKIRVKLTGTNGSGSASANSDLSETVAGVAPVNTDPPSISGDAKVGSTLTGDPGTWTGAPAPDLTYQWQRCDADGTNCVDISGADGLNYELTNDDVGKKLKFKVTGSNDAGTVDALSDPTAVITPAPSPSPSKPAVEPRGGAGPSSLRLKIRCAGSSACRVKITGKLKGGNGTVKPKMVRVGAGKQAAVKVEYTPTLISEIKSRGGGRIAIKAKQVGGATRTITVRVRLPKPVTG